MYKVRTAKSQFRGSCGHPIVPGSKFVVEEPRPSFHCGACARSRIEAALKEVLAELTENKPVADGAR